jgi:hypothetical protein
MATVLWDLDGSSIENFMQHKTITDAAVLNDFKVMVSEGRIGKVTCMPCIFHSDSPVHMTKSSPSYTGLWFRGIETFPLQSTPPANDCFCCDTLRNVSLEVSFKSLVH